MSDTNTGTPAGAAPAAPAYTQVTIIRTDEVEGHTYRRGERPNVDGPTLAALRAKGMLADAASG